MLDLGHLPARTRTHISKYTRPSTVTNTQWHMWTKPRGVTMVHILCIGGGGGGGGGFTGTATTDRGGGGGGGSSGHAIVVIPAHLLPDSLYIQVGAGGTGVGSGGGTAGSGVLSYVSVYPNTSASNIVALSGAAGAVGGTTGTGAAVGTGGAAGTIPVIGSMPRALLGNFNLIAGQAGVNGGAIAGGNGTAITIPTTGCCTQGGSGGAGAGNASGSNFAGGACTAIADTLLSEMRPATPGTGTFDGSGGPQSWAPFFSFGGLGGSSADAAAGGAGGKGAYGAGGGGGGAGTTGGRGGDGGQGIVIITAW